MELPGGARPSLGADAAAPDTLSESATEGGRCLAWGSRYTSKVQVPLSDSVTLTVCTSCCLRCAQADTLPHCDAER